MNKLSREARAQILGMMVEGMSMRSISRMTGASKNTIVKLLADAGEAFSEYQDRVMRDLTCKRVQVDEIWAFVYAKAKNVPGAKAAPEGAGDCWTWMAIDADTKLIPSFYVGARDAEAAQLFIGDLALRLANRVQLTSDGHKPYLEAVEQSFGADIDYAMLVKIYGGDARRRPLQPRRLQGCDQDPRGGQARPSARQHQLRRAGQPDAADGLAPVHPAHQRLLKEGREPRAFRRDPPDALQFRPHPPDAPLHPCHGGEGQHDPLGACGHGEGAGRMGDSIELRATYSP